MWWLVLVGLVVVMPVVGVWWLFRFIDKVWRDDGDEPL